MPFTCDIPVRFGFVDQARIVYYPWLFHFCHEAMERMFEAVAKTAYKDVLDAERLGFPAVHIEVDFHRPVPFGETVRMEVSVVKVGRTSVTFRFDGRRVSDGEIAFRATKTTVCCDMVRFAPVSIPRKYRVAFATIPATDDVPASGAGASARDGRRAATPQPTTNRPATPGAATPRAATRRGTRSPASRARRGA